MTEHRPNSAQRGYDAEWRRRRAEQLERQPWCEICRESGVDTAANTVDHRRARRLFSSHLQHSDAPGGADHPSNLRSLCGSGRSRRGAATNCHNRRPDDKARSAR